MTKSKSVVLLSVPGLCGDDLATMPNLSRLVRAGDRARLTPGFPAVTCPVQANMTTGVRPDRHGVVANGFYWRDRQEVEMWTAGNDCIRVPQIWDLLHQYDAALTSAVWFAMHSKGCGADYVCVPAPIHRPNGAESPWCYTKPKKLYNGLRDRWGHFPLQHFWGPRASILSSRWIVDSAIEVAQKFRPHFFYVYLPHLDYANQKIGPQSGPSKHAVEQLDEVLERLIIGLSVAYQQPDPLWLVASEYTMTAVDGVVFPNRLLREAGLLQVMRQDDGEHLDLEASQAWTLVDHQCGHVFVRDSRERTIRQVAALLQGKEGIAEVLTGANREKYQLNHSRTGDVVLISQPDSWQAYYWWLDDAQAPTFARTVDIHRKPGYDPVELHFDLATRSIPLDTSLIGGSHGAPVEEAASHGVLLSSEPGVLSEERLRDTEIANLVLRQFVAA